MKRLFISVILITFSSYAESQVLIKREKNFAFEIGYNTDGLIMDYKDPVTFDKAYFIMLGIRPYLGYFPIQNFGFGFSSYYSFVKSNFVSMPPLYAVGLFAKYYFPYNLNKPFFRRMDFFSEINYNRTNYLFSENQPVYQSDFSDVSGPIVYKRLSQNNINIIVGLNFKIYKNFYWENSLKYGIFCKGNSHFGGRTGITYYFIKSK